MQYIYFTRPARLHLSSIDFNCKKLLAIFINRANSNWKAYKLCIPIKSEPIKTKIIALVPVEKQAGLQAIKKVLTHLMNASCRLL